MLITLFVQTLQIPGVSVIQIVNSLRRKASQSSAVQTTVDGVVPCLDHNVPVCILLPIKGGCLLVGESLSLWVFLDTASPVFIGKLGSLLNPRTSQYSACCCTQVPCGPSMSHDQASSLGYEHLQ